MVRLLWGVAEVLVVALIAYNLVLALFGWRSPPPPPRGERRSRLRVVIPAHNEAHVIGGLLGDMRLQDYPGERFQTWVLADRCEDDTAAVARSFGAQVTERREGAGGKGPALSWFLERQPLGPDEALVVIDADNRVPTGLLTGLSDGLEAGHRAIQAYVDVANPDASALTTASALSYWASNRMVQLARANLGWHADLGGTGMCVTAPALDRVGGFGDAETEDQELGVRLHLAGIPVFWAHHLRIFDEKPTSGGVALRQRARWAGGRRHVARAYLGALLRARSAASLDMAIRLVQPSRMGVAVFSAALAAASAAGAPLMGWVVWAALAAIQVLAPIPFLVRDGVPAKYLARYPLLALLPLIQIPARLIRRDGWYHTPHGG